MGMVFTWACLDCGKLHINDTHYRTRCRDEMNCQARQRINYIKNKPLDYMMDGERDAKESQA